MPKLQTLEDTPAGSAQSSSTSSRPLSDEQLRKMHAYWRAANYLTVGQIYLKDNPLLERPLTRDDIKPRLLGHWGTTAGLNFIYTHLNRLIVENDLNMIYIIGPGHGDCVVPVSRWAPTAARYRVFSTT